jgi:predicted Zn-dependent peptidase
MGSNVTAWDFGAQVSQANSKPLLDVIIKQLRRLQQGEIDKEDLEMAKQYRLGAFQMSAQTVGSLVRGYSEDYFYDGTIENYAAYPDRIKAVTKTQMVKTVQEMFADKVWGLGVLSNCGEATAQELRSQIETLWK